TAFVPLLLYYYLKYYKDKKKIMLLFFVIGVLTNLHFITAAVFVAILMLTEIIHEKKICVKNLIIQSSSYLLGASPFIIKGLMISKLMIPIEILHFRIGYQYFISITKVFFLFLIPTIFAFFGFSLKLKNQTTKDIIILEFFVSSILFSIIIYFISALSSFIAPLQLTRATKFIFVFLLLYMSYFINKLINMRENKIKVLGGIITLLLLIPSSYVFLTIFSSSNELIILDFRTNEIIQETQSNQEMYYEYSFESIKETSEWISKNTKKNQVIITNPQISTLFRVYAKRPIKISWKDGGNLILTRSNQSKRWYSELIKWNNLYKIGGETTYNYASNNADIFICENNKIFENKVPNFRNQDFSVYIFSKDS
ncbi:hypothetical protein HOK76_01715, partial [archaeon]|nr:hypothetical protein [archaeon]